MDTCCFNSRIKHCKTFVNGVNVDEYTNSGDLTSQFLQIGRTHDNYDYVGYIQDYRVYKGVAKYTSNFIPAAGANPNILPDSPSGVATKSKLKRLLMVQYILMELMII